MIDKLDLTKFKQNRSLHIAQAKSNDNGLGTFVQIHVEYGIGCGITYYNKTGEEILALKRDQVR